jgi:hypothetical protein
MPKTQWYTRTGQVQAVFPVPACTPVRFDRYRKDFEMKGKQNGSKAKVSEDSRARITQDQLAERRRNRGNSEPFDWGSADPSKVVRAIIAVTSCGWAIQFGLTNDGGAGVVQLWDYKNPSTREFVRPTEDVDYYLEALAQDFGANI